ncbi:hypothetical protein [Rhizobium tumorigenes]|uniref:AP2/ERF domain-containing protein n=1 Tax=Rhizobium tumorigenes TaxID=2041385 RepID=A0AAF1K857_9HYPH|nr:hypothetical protein [Rhizobium tumorigenes]WFR97544.1 hypothetical protein PR017_20215 [Rhizobium tumorigenes]
MASSENPTTPEKQQDDADTYGLTREPANKNRGAGWSVALRRRGHKIVRLFKDSIYGSSEASYERARAYRDAIISAVPPPTNHEQAVQIRRNNHSGISGVRRVETESGDAWQATLLTKEGQKRETFPVGRYGEEVAKSMAIAQRSRWLKGLAGKHLAYSIHSEEVTRHKFNDQLVSSGDVMPHVQITEEEIVARLAAIDVAFDADRPPRLRVRVKSYAKGRLSVAISDGGQPAQRKLIQLNTASLSHADMLQASRTTIGEVVAAFYNADVARWFMETHGSALLAEANFDSAVGFNVLVWIPGEVHGK